MNAPAKTTELLSPAVALQQQELAINLARAEIDQQIATARAYPRSITRAIQNITTLATLDEETAQECIFALPRGGKPIVGPSIRLAEIIISQWGNCRAATRVVHIDRNEKYVEAEGIFHDLETNTATSAKVRRRISDKGGKIYNDDMIIVTGNAAASIAKRNAILGGVPKAVWRRAYEQAEQVIKGTAETLVVTREKTMKAYAAFGLTPERVCAMLGVGGIADITLEHMPTLRGTYAALKNGEVTVEELFGDTPAKPAKTVEIPEEDEAPAAAKDPAPAPAAEVKAPESAKPDEVKQEAQGELIAETEEAIIERMEEEIVACDTKAKLSKYQADKTKTAASLSEAAQMHLLDVIDAHRETLKK